MDGLDFFQIDMSMADEARGFLMPEVITSLKAGLPVLAIGAAAEGAVVGALGGALDADTFDIVSLFVTPVARKQGVGTGLIETLKELLAEKDEGLRITAIRASYTEQNRDNRALEPFFLALGFRADSLPLPMYYLSPVRKSVTKMSAIKGGELRLSSFDEVSEEALKSAQQEAALSGAPLPENGLCSKPVDKSISFCITGHGRVVAYTAAELVEEGIINLSAIFSQIDDRRVTMAMLAVQLAEISEKYGDNTVIAMLAVDEASESIIKELFPEAKPASKKFIL